VWAERGPSGLRRFVPILSWLPGYDRGALRFDAIAGATVWGLLVPEMIAYSGLAGLPPQAGLYTLLATLTAYAIFGTSRHVVAAGTSAAAVLLASTVGKVAVSHDDYLANAAALVLFVGGLFLPRRLPAGVHRAVSLAASCRGVRLRARDLRHGQTAAEAVRDLGWEWRHDPPVRPRARTSR
jgi:hypothetical protein